MQHPGSPQKMHWQFMPKLKSCLMAKEEAAVIAARPVCEVFKKEATKKARVKEPNKQMRDSNVDETARVKEWDKRGQDSNAAELLQVKNQKKSQASNVAAAIAAREV
jgi:hypothetical protein